jgi:transcriptional regulator with XRE-family HTH domain
MGPGTMSARVGANVKRYRTERGMSQERAVALLADIGLPMSDAALSRLETGQRSITVEHLAAFAELLDCAMSDLLEAPIEGRSTLTLPSDGAGEESGALTADAMVMLSRLAVVTPETQGTLDRIAAMGSAGLRTTLVRHVRPLLEALVEAGDSRARQASSEAREASGSLDG